jgi:hypothetical protein
MGWMAGYGTRTKKATGVHEELHARALAIDDSRGKTVVLVTADLCGFSPPIVRAIRRDAAARFALAAADLLLVASHTHGGPMLPYEPVVDVARRFSESDWKEIAEYGAFLTGRVLEAIGKALDARAPATLSFGRGEARFAVNRRLPQPDGSVKLAPNPAGVTDPDVPALWVESAGVVRAVVFTYACHGTSVGAVYEYNADHAGPAARRLEASLPPGTVALFATGCGGDLQALSRGSFRDAQSNGEALASAVIATKAAASRVDGPLRTASRVVELPLSPLPDRATLEKGLASKRETHRRLARAMLDLVDAGKAPASIPVTVQVWRFGDRLTLVAIGGETCVEYALRVKRELGAERTWVVGYANEIPCYLPSERVLSEGGYEAGWDREAGRGIASGSILHYGWPVPLAPALEDRIVGAVRDLARP